MKRYRQKCLFYPSYTRTLVVISVCSQLASLFVEGRDDGRNCLSVSSSYHDQAVVSVRGGDNTYEDDDDDERTRFWSLGALFRLNANAKDDASLPPYSSEDSIQFRQGSGRGGALAVHTRSRPNKRYSTETDRQVLFAEDEEPSSRNEAKEQTKPMEAVSIKEEDEEDSDSGEVSELEVSEGSDTLGDRDETIPESIMDTTPISTASSRLIEDEEERNEGMVEAQYAEILHALVVEEQESEEITSRATNVNQHEKQPSRPEKTRGNETSRTRGVRQDASKLWWTKVRAEAEDIAELEGPVSDESDFGEIAAEEELRRSAEGVSHSIVDEGTLQKDMEPSSIELEPELPVEISKGEISQPEAAFVAADIEEPKLESSVSAELSTPLKPTMAVTLGARGKKESPYISSGYWGTIDKVTSLGLSEVSPSLKLSRHLRSLRKSTARATGLHGFLSRKGRELASLPENAVVPSADRDTATLNDEDLGIIRRRIAAIQIARKNVARKAATEEAEVAMKNRRGIWRWRNNNPTNDKDAAVTSAEEEAEISSLFLNIERKSLEEQLDYERRKNRVMEIDSLISTRQKELLDLQCEKDTLQRRPNPFFDYTTEADGKTQRKFIFPPEELVDEYISELFATRRLEKMNHTHLWKSGAGFDDDDDEGIGDDLLTPSADARKLYRTLPEDLPLELKTVNGNGNGGNGGGGSWLLRQNIGKASLGEKIGQATETAAYKAVAAAVMSSLARGIAAIHGVNIMGHTDIRLYMEQSPDLPPVGKNVIPGSDASQDYAHDAIMAAMQRGVRKSKKRGSRSRRRISEEAFLQRDAVVETLISHCQISAPLLKLFPLAWQRALLGNIVTLVAAVVSDFCDGIQLQIIGHRMSFAFKPITESDIIRHIGSSGNSFNHRRTRPEQFEAAVRATAEDVSEKLQFLDRWHHRALGSGMLRAQIANLIARIVLTLADEVLSGASFDLWSAQAGGPRMIAGLEYRTTLGSMDGVM